MSNRYSILAIGVAALFMICAVSGALIIASDNNDSDTANDSNSSTRIRSYSSYSYTTDSVAEESTDNQMVKPIRFKGEMGDANGFDGYASIPTKEVYTTASADALNAAS